MTLLCSCGFIVPAIQNPDEQQYMLHNALIIGYVWQWYPLHHLVLDTDKPSCFLPVWPCSCCMPGRTILTDSKHANAIDQ